jgi:hypothetical protein
MFGFWWESHSDTSIFYKHHLFMQIPLLILISSCVAVTARRRFQEKTITFLEVGSYVTMPVIAVLIYLTFSGVFGPPPMWL